MKFMFALFAALALISAPTMAADSGFYVGAGLGQSSFDIGKGEVDEFLGDVFAVVGDELGIGVSYDIESSKLDDSDTAFSLFAGYRFMPYLAVEGAWLDLGEASYKSTGTVTVADGDGDVSGDAEVKLDWSSNGFALSALGIWPVTEQWDIFGRLGVFFADTELAVKGTPLDVDGESLKVKDSESSTEFIWGLGVDFYFLDNIAARLEYQMIPDLGDKNTTGETDVDVFSLGVLYRF